MNTFGDPVTTGELFESMSISLEAARLLINTVADPVTCGLFRLSVSNIRTAGMELVNTLLDPTTIGLLLESVSVTRVAALDIHHLPIGHFIIGNIVFTGMKHPHRLQMRAPDLKCSHALQTDIRCCDKALITCPS